MCDGRCYRCPLTKFPFPLLRYKHCEKMKAFLLTLMVLTCINGIFGRPEWKVPKKAKMSKSDQILLQKLFAEARYEEGMKSNSTVAEEKKVSSRISFLDAGFSGINGFLEYFTSTCHHGYNCGEACGPCTKSYYNKCSSSYSFSMKWWIDDLDQACWRHDICLKYYRTKVKSKAGRRKCDRTLAAKALSIYNRNYKCSWWNIFCVENWYVTNAWLINKAMVVMSKIRS